MSPHIGRDELNEIDVKAVIDETPRAVQLLTMQGTRHWLPRSQIVEMTDESVLIPYWLAEANGIARAIELAMVRAPCRRRSMTRFRSDNRIWRRTMITADQTCIAAAHQLAEALGLEIGQHPAAFPKRIGDPVRPLAIGVRDEIVALKAEEASRNRTLKALCWYCGSLSYLMALSADGAVRVDLDGNEAEPVSSDHAERARCQIIERRERREQLADERKGSGPEPESSPKPAKTEPGGLCNATIRAALGLSEAIS